MWVVLLGCAAANDGEGGLDVGRASLQRWHLVNGRISAVLAGQAGRPGSMATDERGDDLEHGQPVGWGVVCDAFEGVDSAQANVEPVGAVLAELVDGPGEPLGDLAFLDDGDLLAQTLIGALGLLVGQFKLFAGAVVAELCLLAGVLELLAAYSDLSQSHRSANAGATEDKQGRQALKQGGAGIVLELVATFAARSPVSR
jgi:hypothetical protein